MDFSSRLDGLDIHACRLMDKGYRPDDCRIYVEKDGILYHITRTYVDENQSVIIVTGHHLSEDELLEDSTREIEYMWL